MRFLVILLLCLHICHGYYNNGTNNLKWDDPRISFLGSGFDSLTSEFKQSIFVLESSEHYDPDAKIDTSRLPKGVIMKSEPENNFQIGADVVSTTSNIKEIRDLNLDGKGSFKLLHAAYSKHTSTVKTFASKQNHKVTTISTSITLAEFNLQTVGLEISIGLKRRIEKIANLLDKNTQITRAIATSLVDEVLRLFGTHIIVNEKIGGILSKIDAVDISGFTQSVDQKLASSASASFGTFFGVNAGYSTEYTDTETYDKSVTETRIHTIGGDPWHMSYTYDTWVDTIMVNPATIGLNAIYITDIISDQYFPNLDYLDLIRIKQLFFERLRTYFKNNMFIGCSDPNSSNFVTYANIFDDKMCEYNREFHLGGFYTTSNVPELAVPNILTNGFSCPANYTSYPLLDLGWRFVSSVKQSCHRKKKHWYGGHKTVCYNYNVYSDAETHTNVCLSDTEQEIGVFFGGAFTQSYANDITRGGSCPEKYILFPIYHDSSKKIVTSICIAPYDSGAIVSVPFGGIMSSQYPNHLVNDLPVCGEEFERHPVGSNPIAELTYCVKIGSIDKNLKIKEVTPPGYGAEDFDQFELFKLDETNGTNIGIQVDPHNFKTYNDQVETLAKKIVPIENVKKRVKRDLEIDLEIEYCPLRNWMEQTGLYEELFEKMKKEESHEMAFVIPKEKEKEKESDPDSSSSTRTESSNSSGKKWILPTMILLSAIAFVMLIVAILYAYKKKQHAWYQHL